MTNLYKRISLGDNVNLVVVFSDDGYRMTASYYIDYIDYQDVVCNVPRHSQLRLATENITNGEDTRSVANHHVDSMTLDLKTDMIETPTGVSFRATNINNNVIKVESLLKNVFDYDIVKTVYIDTTNLCLERTICIDEHTAGADRANTFVIEYDDYGNMVSQQCDVYKIR